MIQIIACIIYMIYFINHSILKESEYLSIKVGWLVLLMATVALSSCGLNTSVALLLGTPSELYCTNATKCCRVKAARSQFPNSFSVQTGTRVVKKQCGQQENRAVGEEMESKGEHSSNEEW